MCVHLGGYISDSRRRTDIRCIYIQGGVTSLALCALQYVFQTDNDELRQNTYVTMLSGLTLVDSSYYERPTHTHT